MLNTEKIPSWNLAENSAAKILYGSDAGFLQLCHVGPVFVRVAQRERWGVDNNATAFATMIFSAWASGRQHERKISQLENEASALLGNDRWEVGIGEDCQK